MRKGIGGMGQDRARGVSESNSEYAKEDFSNGKGKGGGGYINY